MISKQNYIFFKIVLFLANIVDPAEMQHYAAFHLGLHCLLTYRLGVSGIQRVNLDKVCNEENKIVE